MEMFSKRTILLSSVGIFVAVGLAIIVAPTAMWSAPAVTVHSFLKDGSGRTVALVVTSNTCNRAVYVVGYQSHPVVTVYSEPDGETLGNTWKGFCAYKLAARDIRISKTWLPSSTQGHRVCFAVSYYPGVPRRWRSLKAFQQLSSLPWIGQRLADIVQSLGARGKIARVAYSPLTPIPYPGGH